ncbi:hypothetical protein F5Y14DRAFT_460911 [Nemania sp. NC0429]|nr:hypothetical protein F5Y14DRAFT_460911 [Nemania sp. NC0429]
MAILEEVPGMEVTIQIDGQNVTEYDGPQASDSVSQDDSGCPVVSKYIESIGDAEFTIKLTIDGKLYYKRGCKVMDHLVFHPKIDGRWVRSAVMSIVDDRNAARIQKDIKATKDLGIIQIEVERHIYRGELPPSQDADSTTTTLEVAEKALKGKAISHSTSVGKREPGESLRLMNTRRIPADNGPIAVFRFLYRSREDLKQELVIPRTPEPELATPAVQQSIHDMTEAQIHRLAQERLDQIKQDEEAKGHSNSIVKKEGKRGIREVIDVDEEAGEARAAKRRAITIDLTDD